MPEEKSVAVAADKNRFYNEKYFDKRLMGVFFNDICIFLLRPAKLKRLKACDRKAACFLVFNNIAGTRYDEKLTQIALEKLQKKIEGIYLEIDAEPYGENFKEKSFEKASFAELTAQVDGCGADYFVYTELQPITKETHFNFIYFDKNVETGLVLRIVDLKNDKELYNKKYLIKAEDSTDYFFIGSGSVAQKALDAILFRAGEAISVKLPL